jgi:peptidyl-dipeptidase A
MRKKKYTPKKMLEIADAFFQSLGLKKLPKAFWEKSVYVKPKGVESSCHPSAYDMCLGRFGEDYRISMCAVVSQKDFATMHHELGHIQYMMQYAHQRYAFRTPPNPGFDESIGDVLAMSVTTPEHLQCYLGLDLGVKLDCGKGKSANKKYPVTETDINYLYMTALESLAFFPFSIAMDAFRWLIMEGKVQAKDFNAKWWEIRKDLQGVIPPKPRPANMFDPAAKYHTVVHVSYMSYFVSTILQFDFYEALCKAAGQFDPSDPNGKPLYKCDFTGSKKAGKLFANMLKKGNKTPWPKALRALTGRSCITTKPMLNYFKPLFEKLKQLLKEGHQDDCLTKEWV